MQDNNWELINGAIAHRIETLNALNVVNVIETIVLFILARTAGHPPGIPNGVALSELHRSGTLFLLESPGKFRDCEVHVVDGAGHVLHTPPTFAQVPTLMKDFQTELEAIWRSGDALDVAAFALWKINWIHPFKNGNGRTARAFCYACLSTKIGAVLPGAPTVIDQITATRPEYEACIREGDSSFASGALNLARMKSYLNGLLQTQIGSVAPQPPGP